MDASDTALHGQNTTAGHRLYMAFELGEKSWKLSLGDGRRAPSRCTVAAGDTTAVLAAVANARARCDLGADAPVYTCYEAGRDGFWLHRWLMGQGIANLVVDSASIEVNRRARRAKTDRLDSDKLLSMLIRYYTGERRVWAVARIPTPEQEDDRRLHGELERLRHERTAHTNRICSLLVLDNLRVRYVGGRIWTHWWTRQRDLLVPGLRAEIGVFTLSEPIDDEREIDKGEKHHVQFFEPRKDAAEAFEAAKQALNFVSALVHFPIIFPWFKAIAFGRNDGNETQVERELPCLVTFIRLIH